MIDILTEVRAGLYDSDKVEQRGESGEQHRNRCVVSAAMLKDRDEARWGKPVQIKLHRTPQQALERLGGND